MGKVRRSKQVAFLENRIQFQFNLISPLHYSKTIYIHTDTDPSPKLNMAELTLINNLSISKRPMQFIQAPAGYGHSSVSSSAFYHFSEEMILLKILEKLEKIQLNKKIDWLQEEKTTISKSMNTGK